MLMGDPAPPVENFLIGGSGYMEGGNAYGQYGAQIRGASNNKMAMADIDYKKPKVNVYIQDDIFNRCLNPKEYQHLKE
jgi:hypothetical protein